MSDLFAEQLQAVRQFVTRPWPKAQRVSASLQRQRMEKIKFDRSPKRSNGAPSENKSAGFSYGVRDEAQ